VNPVTSSSAGYGSDFPPLSSDAVEGTSMNDPEVYVFARDMAGARRIKVVAIARLVQSFTPRSG
jgi:hypothetical protein